MDKKRKSRRISKHKVLLPTIDILQAHIGKENGISIKDTCNELGTRNEELLGFSRNTMAELLNELKSDFTLGGNIKCNSGKEEGRVYYYNYYFEPYVSQEELQLIVDDVRSSMLHSSKKGEQLVAKIKKLFPQSMQSKIKNTRVAFASDILMDEHTDKNLEFVKDILKFNEEQRYEEAVLKFIMKGYGIGEKRNPVINKQGDIRTYEVLPLAIALINNRYYLLGYWGNSTKPSVHRIDLMFDLRKEIREVDLSDNYKRAVRNMMIDEGLQEFILQHAYASYGEKHTYRIRAKAVNGAFTYVQSIIGSNEKLDPVKGNPDEAEFFYTCPQRTMEILIRQYMGNLKVVGPEKEKAAIETALVDTFIMDEDYMAALKEKL